jgi:hypothetical protein
LWHEKLPTIPIRRADNVGGTTTKASSQTQKRRRTTNWAADTTVAPREADAPYWLPTDSGWNSLPAEVRAAVPKILTPAYRRFVLEAPNELERSMGMTLVHLMWLEICGQLQLAVAAADSTSLAAIIDNPEAAIDRHLHLVTAKCRTAELFIKFRAVNEMLDRRPPAPQKLPLPLQPAVSHVADSDVIDYAKFLPSLLASTDDGGKGSEV